MVYSSKLVKRDQELKDDAGECLLLMQVGSFMQVQDEDARAVAGVTGLERADGRGPGCVGGAGVRSAPRAPILGVAWQNSAQLVRGKVVPMQRRARPSQGTSLPPGDQRLQNGVVAQCRRHSTHILG